MSILKTFTAFLLFTLVTFFQVTLLTMSFSSLSCIFFVLCDILILIRIIKSAKSTGSIFEDSNGVDASLIFALMFIAIFFYIKTAPPILIITF